MRAVNLLPKDLGKQQTKKQTNPAVLVGVLGGSAVVSVLALMFMFANGGVSQKQVEVESLRAELATIPPPPPGPSAADTQLEGERAQRSAALTEALAARIAWDGVLRRFSLVLPDDVWLTSLGATAPSPPDSDGTLSINGYAYSHDGVARLLARLAVIPDLADVQLQSSSLGPVSGRELAMFTIVAKVKGATA